MKRDLTFLWLFPLLVAFWCGCSDEKEPDVDPVDNVPPALLSTTPLQGSENVSSETTTLLFTFSKEIVLATPHAITLNDVGVYSATANGNELQITVSLTKNTAYQLIIPKDKIRNKAGVALNEAITLSFHTEVPEKPVIAEKLVTPNPSPEAIKLYQYLRENYGEKTISGTMSNVAWNTNEAEWVYQHTGKYPALTCYDYIHLSWSPANWIDYGDITPVKSWWDAGGIVAAGWHWIVPASETNHELNNMTYEPGKTTFRAKNAVVEGTWENEVMKADLEKIAAYLTLLKDANIPLLWRPLHEAAGNIYEYSGGTAWFWWGYDGAEVFKQLWIYMFDYFQSQGLNNLIWVWTTQTKDDAFYPGDQYVDIVGRDIYNSNVSNSIKQYETISEKYAHKIVTLSECGNVGSIADQWDGGGYWSWFMPWYDYARTNDPASEAFQAEEHEHAAISWWKSAFESDKVITRDQLPDLK